MNNLFIEKIKDKLNTTNPIYLLIIYSFISALITILISEYVEKQNVFPFVCIRYTTDIAAFIFIYLFILSQKEKTYMFSENSYNMWYLSLFITILGLICYIIYTNALHKVGPAKTKSISYVFGIIFTLGLSYIVLKNTDINYKGVIGLVLCIIGLYLVVNNANYI